MINKIVFYYYSLFMSLYSTIYRAVFKQKYDRERTYTVRLRIIYNGHNVRLMHDHVTQLYLDYKTCPSKLVCTSVTLASFIQREQ